MVWNKATYH